MVTGKKQFPLYSPQYFSRYYSIKVKANVIIIQNWQRNQFLHLPPAPKIKLNSQLILLYFTHIHPCNNAIRPNGTVHKDITCIAATNADTQY